MNNEFDDVDFDFFDTPRNVESISPKSPGKHFDRKPPPSPPSSSTKHVERPKSGIYHENVKRDRNSGSKEHNSDSDDDSYSDSFSSDSGSETPRVDRVNRANERERNGDKRGNRDSYSGSSSAYSNSDYSSDDSYGKGNNNNNHTKEIIQVNIPKMSTNAWSMDYTKDTEQEKLHEPRKNMDNKGKGREKNDYRKNRSHSNTSDSDSSCERKDLTSGKQHKERVKSAKPNEGRHRGKGRKPLRSTSSSYSNNSDITDVSPLESPEISPRAVRKRYYDNSEKENGQFDDVQYNKSPDREVDIKLESDKIDLSILMKCMADIDKEKQQRLKTNSRRVMFAPPTIHDKGNPNFTYTTGRAKLIEQENQRLLKKIMHHVGPGTVKQTTPAKPKKAVRAEPVVPRLTPSAVNRMREQRRIESDNMHMLNRLQRVRPTSGMSKHEQLKEFERQTSYGIPTGTLIHTGETARYETMPRKDLMSSMSTQRSRPSSAKSNVSLPGGRRSRPSSAKSNASVVSNASMRSNMSLRSNVSKRSTVSMRSTGGKADNRPEWNDRFSFS